MERGWVTKEERRSRAMFWMPRDYVSDVFGWRPQRK